MVALSSTTFKVIESNKTDFFLFCKLLKSIWQVTYLIQMAHKINGVFSSNSLDHISTVRAGWFNKTALHLILW